MYASSSLSYGASLIDIPAIDDVGPLPWACVAGFLKYIESPDQLVRTVLCPISAWDLR